LRNSLQVHLKITLMSRMPVRT